MYQCQDCEFFTRSTDGSPILMCDAFSTVKEPECLAKLQLVQLTTMTQSHQATLDMYRRFAPLQEKLFKHMEQEIDEASDADSWKNQSDNDEDEDDDIFRL